MAKFITASNTWKKLDQERSKERIKAENCPLAPVDLVAGVFGGCGGPDGCGGPGGPGSCGVTVGCGGLGDCFVEGGGDV